MLIKYKNIIPVNKIYKNNEQITQVNCQLYLLNDFEIECSECRKLTHIKKMSWLLLSKKYLCLSCSLKGERNGRYVDGRCLVDKPKKIYIRPNQFNQLNRIFDSNLNEISTKNFNSFKQLRNCYVECNICLKKSKVVRLKIEHITCAYKCKSCSNSITSSGRKPWNTGLTKEIDSRVQNLSNQTKKLHDETDFKLKVRLGHEKTGKWLPKSAYTNYQLYRYLCSVYTDKNDLSALENYKKQGSCSADEYTIDHMYSISKGFQDGILPCVIGNIVNLKCMTRAENSRKHNNCSLTKEELFMKYIESKGDVVENVFTKN